MTIAAKPRCAHQEDALAEAIMAAVEQPLDQQLTEATFGRYATAGEGWYWELTFQRRLGMTKSVDWTETRDRRVKYIIAKWGKDVAIYENPPGNDKTEGNGT